MESDSEQTGAEAGRTRTVVLATGAVVAACLVAAVALSALLRPRLPPASTSRLEVAPTPNVIVAMRELARLETQTFHMERVIELTDEQTHLFGLVKAKDALLLVAAGDVTAGIDLDELRDEDVRVDWPNKTVRVKLPAPEVFTVALDNEKTHVVTHTTDTLAERREDLEGKARAQAESTMRSGAIEGGILTRAKDSGERQVRSLLRSLGFESIQVDWSEP